METCPLVSRLGLAFPDDHYSIAQLPELPGFATIASNIDREFLFPKLGVLCWRAARRAPRMAMPEAPVHEDGTEQIRRYNVRRSRDTTYVRRVFVPKSCEYLLYDHLWRCAFLPHPSQKRRALGCCDQAVVARLRSDALVCHIDSKANDLADLAIRCKKQQPWPAQDLEFMFRMFVVEPSTNIPRGGTDERCQGFSRLLLD